MSARDFFVVGGRRSSVISLFPHRDGPVKKIKFSPFFKNKQSFRIQDCYAKWVHKIFSASSVVAVVAVVRHFPLSSQGRTCEKNQIFAVFQKQAIFPKFKIFRQNECKRLFRRRRSSPSSVVRHFPLSSQGRTCEKNQIFAVFQKQAIFPKFKIIRQNECTRFFCRRRSSVIRHFHLSSQGRTCEENQISTVFQKQAIFPKLKIFRQNECTRLFCRRRSSPSSVVRHFPLSSQGRTCEKNQIFAVFQKQAIFPKFKIFRQNECTRFFCRRRSSVIRHFPLSSQGRTCEKNQIFAVFQKQAIFPKLKIFRQNECTRFFCRRRSSVIRHFPLSSQGRTSGKNQIFAVFQKQAIFQNSRLLCKMSAQDFFGVVGRHRRRSSVISLFRHRDRPVKKIKFSPYFKNKQSSQNSRFLGKMSARDYFAVVGLRRCRSSVISIFRHRDGPVKKIKFPQFFKNKQSFQNSRFLGKMSARDYFAVVGRRRRRSSVISNFRHRDGPVKKNQIFAVFQKQAIFPKFKIIRQNECTRFFWRRRSSVIRHFPLSSQGRTCEKN